MIHQLYCTHCTYGSSYLHQSSDANMASQAFEYSARAGSVPREVSHDFFRRLESTLYYQLPGPSADSPARKLSTPEELPNRLVYFPSLQRLRVAANISYRPEDSQGRPHSYFAHVLLTDTDRAAANWSATDFLRLSGALQWVHREDQVDAFTLPPLRTLNDFSGDHQAVIDDGLIESFVNGSPINFDGDRSVIPERWIGASAEQRRLLIADLLAAFLLSPSGQSRIVIAAEPDFAALLFYAVARMLPPAGQLLRRMSFSTYESDATRPITTLAAVLPGPLTGRRFARRPTIDTTSLELTAKSPDSVEWGCAERLVHEVASAGCQHLDAFLRDCSAASQRDVVEICRAVVGVSQSASQAVAASQVANLKNKTPAVLLQLAAAGSDINAAYGAIDELLGDGDEAMIAQALQHADVADLVKSELLIAFADERKQLPKGCNWILGGPDDDAIGVVDSLITRLVDNFDWKELNEIVDGLAVESLKPWQLAGLCRTLAEASHQDTAKRHTFTRLIDDERVTDQAFLNALVVSESMRKSVFRAYPESEPGLEQRLTRGGLNRLHSENDFNGTLDVLLSACGVLSTEVAARIQGWARIRHHLAEISASRGDSTDGIRRLAEAAIAALPNSTYPEDLDGNTRSAWVVDVGERLHGSGSIDRHIRDELRSYFAGTQ